VKITEIAKNKVAELIKAPNEVMSDYKFFLRVTAIEEDGLKYQVYFDFETRLDDDLIKFDDFDLRIDADSLKYLNLKILDYNENNGFVLDDFTKPIL